MQSIHDELLFIPLGGSGEIGLNLNLYHYKGSWLMVDCGGGFAEHSIMPGIDILVPNISFIIDNKIRIDALVLTHAHEDHVGAICYLWQALRCPIYATKFTAEFLRVKMRDFDFENIVEIVEIIPGDCKSFDIGSFNIEMVGLTHSVPEMQAIVIRTSKGIVVHTGDWKIDPDPVVGPISQESRLREVGEEGVLAMVCDSTNIFSSGWSQSEGHLFAGLHTVVSEARQMVIVTTFASNVARIKTIADVAAKCNRKIVVSGTALHRIIGVARKCEYLLDYEFLDVKDLTKFDRNNVLLLCTGCQGESLATVAKLAYGKHRFCKVKHGDTLIFSSRIIPGNDKKIFAAFNKLVEIGVNVITERDHFVHVSGHPNRDELQYMYDIIKPKVAIPVHGEARHLKEHVTFAKEVCGVKNAVFVKNGYIINLSHDKVEKIGTVFADYLGVNGLVLQRPEDIVMQVRRKLRDSGILICSFVIGRNGAVIYHPQVFVLGCFDYTRHNALIKEIEKRALHFIETSFSINSKRGNDKSARIAATDKLKNMIRNFIKHNLDLDPVVEIICHIV